MITVHPYQADTNCKHISMTCRACVKLPLDVDGIDARIDTQMMKPLHILLIYLGALENERNPNMGTINEDKGDIFSECCTKSFK